MTRSEINKSDSRSTVEVSVEFQVLNKGVNGCWNELAFHRTHGGQAELPRFTPSILLVNDVVKVIGMYLASAVFTYSPNSSSFTSKLSFRALDPDGR